MSIEIERKFLVSSDGWRNLEDVVKPLEYQQGYLSFGEGEASEVRVRLVSKPGQDPHEAVMTVKSKGGLVRSEVEAPIPVEDGLRMLGMCRGTVLRKVRHFKDAGQGLCLEVDVYSGELAGLVVAEVELPTASTPFVPADFLGEEVTENKAYRNATLARDGHPVSTSRPHPPSLKR